MQNILHKTLSCCLCVAYVFASFGFVRHVCNTDNITHLSLLAGDDCSYCLEHKHAEKQCCHHADTSPQTQQNDDDCCEKTVETLTCDQNYSQNNNVSSSIFFIVMSILFPAETDLICNVSIKASESYTPLINSKIPLIYRIEQLRL
jgi:hypothetical protein